MKTPDYCVELNSFIFGAAEPPPLARAANHYIALLYRPGEGGPMLEAAAPSSLDQELQEVRLRGYRRGMLRRVGGWGVEGSRVSNLIQVAFPPVTEGAQAVVTHFGVCASEIARPSIVGTLSFPMVLAQGITTMAVAGALVIREL